MNSQIKSGKRKPFIDIAKGIGIYIIVLVHFTTGESLLRQYLLSFCVPLFFFISGILFSYKREFKEFVINIIHKIGIPFLIYGIIDAFFTLFRLIVIENEKLNFIILAKIIGKVLFISGCANSNGPLWYLPVLIWIQLIMYYPARSKNKWIPAIIGVIMFITGYFIHFKGPFRIGQVPSALVFFIIGFYLKPIIIKINENSLKYIAFPLLTLLFFISCNYNGFSEMAAMNYGNNYFLYYVTAISSTISILSIGMILKKSKLLEFLGSNSLTIMCTHYHFARFIIPWILQAINKEYILEQIIVQIVFSVLLTGFVSLLSIIINKKAPILTGAYNTNHY